MAQTYNCTGCGAVLEYAGDRGHTMRCQFCGTTIPVPEEFWREAEEKQTMSKWGKYLIVFLIITVGIPTCLGLIGAILGIGGSIIGIILAFLAQIFTVLIKIFVHKSGLGIRAIRRRYAPEAAHAVLPRAFEEVSRIIRSVPERIILTLLSGDNRLGLAK